MKVLFDHNAPYKLILALTGQHVETAEDMGWDTLKNGNLLSEAEQEGFQVMVTADKSIFYHAKFDGPPDRSRRCGHERLELSQESHPSDCKPG